MGVFSRFTDIINANINNLLDKAEQPEKMIKLIIQEMQESLFELRSTAASYIAEKKTISRKVKQCENDIANWQSKAELALFKNREDLAKSALREKLKVACQLTELSQQQADIEQQLNALQQDSQALQNKLSEAVQKQQAYIVRQQSTQVRLKVRQKSEQYNIDAVIHKFECYNAKIEQVESQIEAFDLTQRSDVNSQFDMLKADQEIEEELNKLKMKQKTAKAS